jgi:hypothetical protein
MRKIVDYTVLFCVDNADLSTEVREKIKKGWQPYGRPFMVTLGLCQAMVKYADDETGKSSYDEVN